MTSRSLSRSLLERPGGDVLEGLLARDRAAVLLLPERVAAARVVLAVVRVAAVALGVLDDLALAARRGAGRERLALDAQVAALLVAEPGDHLAGEAVDLVAEVLGLLLAALDAVEALLPAAGQLGAGEQVVAEHPHEADALLGGAQAAALALDVLRRRPAARWWRRAWPGCRCRRPSSPRRPRRPRPACRRSPWRAAACPPSSGPAAWSAWRAPRPRRSVTGLADRQRRAAPAPPPRRPSVAGRRRRRSGASSP